MTWYRAAAVAALAVALVAAAGCSGGRDYTEESQRLSAYLLTTEEVAEGNASGTVELVSETTGEERPFASRTWRLGAGASPLRVPTGVESTVYDPEQPSDVFEEATGGNWTDAGSPGMGERSTLLVQHGGDTCGYRVAVQVGNLVSVVDVRMDCAAFGDSSGEARQFALRLARRQATLTTGRPVTL